MTVSILLVYKVYCILLFFCYAQRLYFNIIIIIILLCCMYSINVNRLSEKDFIQSGDSQIKHSTSKQKMPCQFIRCPPYHSEF